MGSKCWAMAGLSMMTPASRLVSIALGERFWLADNDGMSVHDEALIVQVGLQGNVGSEIDASGFL